jgi:hypothetical protein
LIDQIAIVVQEITTINFHNTDSRWLSADLFR